MRPSSIWRLLAIVIFMRGWPRDRAHIGFIWLFLLSAHVSHLDLGLGWTFTGFKTFTLSRRCPCQTGAFANKIISQVIFLRLGIPNVASYLSWLCDLLQGSKQLVKWKINKLDVNVCVCECLCVYLLFLWQVHFMGFSRHLLTCVIHCEPQSLNEPIFKPDRASASCS